MAAEYDVGLHVGALFAVAGASMLGVGAPLLARHCQRRREARGVAVGDGSGGSGADGGRGAALMRVARAAGGGVMAATALVHVLPDAFAALLDPAVSVSSSYGALAGAVCLCAVLAMQLVAYVTHAAMKQAASRDADHAKAAAAAAAEAGSVGAGACDVELAPRASARASAERAGRVGELERGLLDGAGASAADEIVAEAPARTFDGTDADAATHGGKAGGSGCGPSDARAQEHELWRELERGRGPAHAHAHGHQHQHQHHALYATARPVSAADKLKLLSLELAVALHSVIIGVDLGMERTNAGALLVAIVFHQMIEGVGVAGVAMHLGGRSRAAVALALAIFVLSTPVGVAVGIGAAVAATATPSADADAAGVLLAQGVLDAMSAGVLLYSAVVDLMQPLFGEELLAAGGGVTRGNRAACFGAMYAAAGLMCVVAIWA